jgi:hypothetical protein
MTILVTPTPPILTFPALAVVCLSDDCLPGTVEVQLNGVTKNIELTEEEPCFDLHLPKGTFGCMLKNAGSNPVAVV